MISSWPSYDDEQIEAVNKVLINGKVNYWTGSETSNFEKEYCNWTNSKYAVALSNGSLALTAAYTALGIGPGDEIITTPRTFIATTSCFVLLGAKPVFADVNRNSGLITVDTIEPLINNKTKAIVVVHLAGWPANMVEICKLAKKYNIKVVEDCSQAHGAKILVDDKYCSVGTFGDISTWSFCQDKIISTGGEGGIITTNEKKIWEKVWSFKDHGKSYYNVFSKKHPTGYRWLHDNFGTNFRLTEMQSAIGRIQLKKVDSWHKIRVRNAMIIKDKLSKLKLVRIPMPTQSYIHAWYKFYVYLDNSFLKNGWDRNRIIEEINKRKYPAFHGGCGEIYLEKCFQDSGLAPKKRLPIAKDLSENSIMFLVHPTIKLEEINSYAEVIKEVLEMAQK
ncbi:DegT/DnrJ/EryC1/StrS family aminotransferase [uncultured Prochlorococcus sp.]|uniref:DegT/DnrJ/EryC1/StrS aminotransferase family protein n=1 Tax=uncultured Prochlorococcus sp. TaxID=159733 RepID=UPI002583BA7C|nr:DegT/DnrJ/EryC1/StrS aminotransferase family protein [uncultured Prochlorococcus sp.]